MRVRAENLPEAGRSLADRRDMRGIVRAGIDHGYRRIAEQIRVRSGAGHHRCVRREQAMHARRDTRELSGFKIGHRAEA